VNNNNNRDVKYSFQIIMKRKIKKEEGEIRNLKHNNNNNNNKDNNNIKMNRYSRP
jgi:hypothetical protein